MKRRQRSIQKIPLSPEVAFVAVLIGSAISFFTTWSGLRSFMGEHTSPGLAIAISLGVTLLIQLLLVIGVYRVILSNWRAKPLWLVVYVVAAFFSVVFATGFWTSLLEGDDLAQTQAEREVGSYLNDLQHYVSVFQTTAGIVDNLRLHSLAMAELEEEKGTSCGYQTPAIQGPRYRLRMTDAEMFNTYGPRIVTIGDSLQSVAGEVTRIIADFDPRDTYRTKTRIREAIVWARATRTDPALNRLVEYLGERTKTGGMGMSIEGQTIDCPDTKLQALSQDVIASAGSLPELRDPTEVALFGNDTPADAVRLVLNKATGGIAALLGAAPPRSENEYREDRTYQIRNGPPPAVIAEPSLPHLPLILGCVVDLFILLVALAGGRAKFDRGSLVDEMGGALDRLMPDAESARRVRNIVISGDLASADPYGLLNRATRRVAGNDCVVVHSGMTDEDKDHLSKLMDVLVCTRLATPVPKNRLLMRHWRDADHKPERIWLLNDEISAAELRLTLEMLTRQDSWEADTIGSGLDTGRQGNTAYEGDPA